MPKIANDLGPIRFEIVKGPASDAWDARKEDNNNDEASCTDFRANFGALKASLKADLIDLVAQKA